MPYSPPAPEHFTEPVLAGRRASRQLWARVRPLIVRPERKEVHPQLGSQRVRTIVSVLEGAANDVYGNGILAPLKSQLCGVAQSVSHGVAQCGLGRVAVVREDLVVD